MAEIGEVSIKISLDDSGISGQLAEIKKNITSAVRSASKISKNFSLSQQVQDAKKLNSYFDNMAQKSREIARNMRAAVNANNKTARNNTRITNPTKETNTRLQRQYQDFLRQQTKERQEAQKEEARMQEQFSSQDNKSNGNNTYSLNSVLKSSMKILRITTTITAVYALIKTAVRAWEKTIKAVFNVYKELVTVIGTITAKTATFVYKLSGAQIVINGIKSAFQYVKDAATKAFSIDNIKNFIGECAELASNLTEIKNIFDTIYDSETSNKMQDWANSITDTFGLNANTASKYAATFTAMFNSMGKFSNDQMAVMSQNMTQATADLASFMNLDYDTAFRAMQSGLAGQTKALMKYGISVHVATLNEYLLNKGINATMNDLTQSQKMYVRQAYILEAMSDAQGDFNKTQFTYANQTRLLTQNLEVLKASIGQLIKGALTPLVIMLNTLIKLITELLAGPIAALKGALSAKFGIELDTTQFHADIDDVVEDVDDAVGKIKKTVSSFDELHKLNGDDSKGINLDDLLSGLNAVYKQIEENTEGNTWQKLMENIWSQLLDAWKNKDFTELGKKAGQAIKNGLQWVNDNVNSVFEVLSGLGKSLATFINGLFADPDLFVEAAKTLSNAIKGMMLTATEFLINLDADKVGIAINEFITGLFSEDEDGLTNLDRFSTMLATGINRFSRTIKTAFSNLDVTDIGNKIARAINDLFANINFESLGEAIGSIATALTGSISAAISKINWQQIGSKLNTFLKNLFTEDKDGNTFVDYAGDIIVNFVNGLITAANEILSGEGLQKMNSEIKEFFAKIKDNIDWAGLNEVGVKLLDELQLLINSALESIDWFSLIPIITKGLEMVIAGVITFLATAIVMLGMSIGKFIFDYIVVPIGEIVMGIVAGIIAAVTGLINNIIGLLQTIWELLGLAWNKLGEWLENIVNAIAKFFDNIYQGFWHGVDKIKKNIDEFKKDVLGVFSGLWEGIKNIFSGVANWFKDIFSKAADGIKSAMDKVKSWFGWGDKEVDVNVNSANVPKHANGAYMRANTPHLAVVGDNKHSGEFVMPEDKMTQLLDERINNFFNGEFINAMANALGSVIGGNTNTGDINVALNVDGTALGMVSLTQQQINAARGGR